MDLLDVFRVNPNGSFVWIGSADSLQTAHEMIKASKVDPSDAFLIHDSQRNNTFTVQMDELPSSLTH
jgi:hypothetical protein